MFRELRRKDRQIEDSEVIELLNRCSYGVLSTTGEDGYPYGVPVSYVYADDSIYFHCAKEGHKVDNISQNNKVSFCVVGETAVLPDKFSMKYESVILFGRAEEVFGDEKKKVLMEVLSKYSKDFLNAGEKYIKNDVDRTKVMKIKIEHISGKARR